MNNSEDNIVRCGNKGRHLAILDGYRLLRSNEKVIDFDMVADFKKPSWMSVQEDELGLDAFLVGDFVIRKIEQKIKSNKL